jgi:alanine racemase
MSLRAGHAMEDAIDSIAADPSFRDGMTNDPAIVRAGAFLTVDLDAIAANWRALRDLGRTDGRRTDCAAVLKADAYGTGAPTVGARLAAEGCRHFFVAHIDEGIALRAVLPDAAIYVLNGLLPGSEGELAAHQLIPALGDLGQISAWRACAQRTGAALDAVIHHDTGMNRLGLPQAEVDILAHDRGRLRGLRLALLMSHLVASEEADKPVNHEQLERFRAFVKRMPGAPASLANSSGIFLGPDWHFDLLRPGAALYGINPLPGRDNPMHQAVALYGKILQTRRLEPLETVGYGQNWRAGRSSRIATVAVGYADGYLRALANRGLGFIEGLRVPVVGRVSMDLITVDVTDLPEAMTPPGAVVELIGPHQTPDEVAEQARTNGYEILTALGGRYHRVYLQAQAA